MDKVLVVLFAIVIFGIPIYGPFIGPFLNYLEKRRERKMERTKQELASLNMQDKAAKFRSDNVAIPIQRFSGFFPATLFLTVALFYLIPRKAVDFFASNYRSRGDLADLVQLALIAVLGYLVTLYVKYKWRKAQQVIENTVDPYWHLDTLKKQVVETFIKIQEAKNTLDPEPLKNLLNTEFYEEFGSYLESIRQIECSLKIEDITLPEVKIVKIEDYQEDANDNLWFHLTYSLLGYKVDKNGLLVSGDCQKRVGYVELWHFTREDDRWVLNEIRDESLLDLFSFKSFSEEVRN